MIRALALAAGLSLAAGGAGTRALMAPEKAIDLVAEAFAFSDTCDQWAADPVMIERFLASQEIRVDSRYSEAMSEARARQKRAALKLDRREACSRAIENFGPQGRKLPDLIRLR